MNRSCLFLLLILVLNSCNLIQPFFIKNAKKEERKDKRVEKKIDRKEEKIEKKQEKLEEIKGNAKLPPPLSPKRDSLVVKTVDTQYAFLMINHRTIRYNSYQSKAKVHFESLNEKQNFTINFRMKKDSIIWASISAPIIGEVARAIITADSVKAFERINKRVYLYSYSNLQKLINLSVDFETLQRLIIGNAIAIDGEVTEIKELGNFSNILIKGKDYTNQVTVNRADTTLSKLQVQTSRPASASTLLITLSQYQLSDNRLLPFVRQYHILDMKGAIQLDMDINKADFDQPVDFPFNIPKNYKLAE
jgi:hypothetical protein